MKKCDCWNSFLPKFSSLTSFLAVMLFSLVSTSAFASISIVGALNEGTLTGSGESDSLSAKPAFGAGILIDHPISIGTAIEFGAIYQGRKYDDTSSNYTVSSNAIQIPVLLRFTLLPMISFGAGGYWETGSGDITLTNDTDGSKSTLTYSGLGVKQSDMGLVGSIRLNFLMGPGMGFLVDGRYNYGLTNTSNNGTTITNRAFQVLAGISLGFGGR